MLLPALPVDLTESGLDVDEVRARAARGEPPASAEEYLMRVRLESEALPEIAEAEGVDPTQWEGKQTPYMPAQPPLPPTPAGLEPSAEWTAGVLQDFLDLRLGLATLEEEHGVGKDRKVKVPPLKEEGKWRRFFFGSSGRRRGRGEGGVGGGGGGGEGLPVVVKRPRVEEQQQQQEEEEEGEIEEEGQEQQEGQEEEPAATVVAVESAGVGVGPMKEVFEGPHAPGTGLVLQFDQVCTVRLLGYHAQWLEASPRLGHEQGAWLFALLARLSQPLHPEAAALVRQIYRRCWTLRAALPPITGGDAAAASSMEGGTATSTSTTTTAALPAATDAADASMEATTTALPASLADAATMEEEGKQHLGRLNTLIAITGTYFSQGEEEVKAAVEAAMTLEGQEQEEAVEEEEEEGDVLDEDGEEEEEEEGEIRD